jgi:hypothetical protein
MLPIVLMLASLLMGLRLRDLYLGGHYVCPGCGARSQDRHSEACPWGR